MLRDTPWAPDTHSEPGLLVAKLAAISDVRKPFTVLVPTVKYASRSLANFYNPIDDAIARGFS